MGLPIDIKLIPKFESILPSQFSNSKHNISFCQFFIYLKQNQVSNNTKVSPHLFYKLPLVHSPTHDPCKPEACLIELPETSGIKNPKACLIELLETLVHSDIDINLGESVISSIDNMEPNVGV